jgi:hypothetical protein
VTVAELSAVQTRYGVLSDRLKATWTMQQFVSGVFAHVLRQQVTPGVDLMELYGAIRPVAAMLKVEWVAAASSALDEVEAGLSVATRELLEEDGRIGPSIVRRFFERLRKQDESLIEYLIRFYLYAGAVEGDRRDKLDFLFTRLGEDFDAARGEFVMRDSLELRQRVIPMVALRRLDEPPAEEVVRLIRAVRSMREDVASTGEFDDLVERNLLKDARTFKHRVGDLYFHPDVLLAVIDMNVATKNRFHRLYRTEEQKLLIDADKLMEHGTAIARNFGDSNPALVDEIARFRDLREQFEQLRNQSNVKHDLVARLKESMSTILSQLDRGLASEEEQVEIPASFFEEARRTEALALRFGRGEPLLQQVLRIDAVIESADPGVSADEVVESPDARDLRLEPWEVAAYQKLLDRRPAEGDEDTEELWLLYVRAAALRLKVDEEATILATALAAGVKPDAEVLNRARQSLELAKELDETFGDFLQEAVYYTNRRIVHQLYRSRFRLLRGFSGLWLIYDRQS